MASSTKIKGNHHVQGNVQVNNVSILCLSHSQVTKIVVAGEMYRFATACEVRWFARVEGVEHRMGVKQWKIEIH